MTIQVEKSPSNLAGLLRGVVGRDPAAFTRLVEMLDGDLIRLAYVIAGDQEAARDAAQATWERLWHRPPAMRDDERIKAWLLTVAANEARRTMRRRKRGAVLEGERLRVMDLGNPIEAADALDLTSALMRLPVADRELLGLRYGIGMTSPAIALHLRLTPEGVRTRLRRTLLRLRKELIHE